MSTTKADIISRLRKDILPLQGFRHISNSPGGDAGLGPIRHAFPDSVFPLGAVHEFCCTGAEDAAASSGFIAGILSSMMKKGEVCLWICPSRVLFPPALKSFGIDPDKVIFIELQKEKNILWAMEEALKCDGLAAVVCEMQEIGFTVSRRFQLAVEQSGVTGFILRRDPRYLSTTACVTRWKISPLPSSVENDMPGVGFPRWNVELLKVRNGKPGSWQIEWIAGRFRHMQKLSPISFEQKKKAG
jgi:protein ImuA